MRTPLQITFRGVSPSKAIEAYVRTRADRLERFCDRIIGSHVMLETLPRHQSHGLHHRVRIDIAVPGRELVVSHDPAAPKEHEDLYASIDDAFDLAQRVLQDYVRVQRGAVKQHEVAPRGGRPAKS